MSINRTDNDHGDRRRELLDTPGVAKYIASSVRHVRRLVAERTIPHYKVGHFVRFNPDEIDDWLRQHRRGAKRRTPRRMTRIPSPSRRRPAQAEPSDSSPRTMRAHA